MCVAGGFFFRAFTAVATCKYSGRKWDVRFFVRPFVRWKIPFWERWIAEYTFKNKTEFFGDNKCCLWYSENGILEQSFLKPCARVLALTENCVLLISVNKDFYGTAQVWAVWKKQIGKQRTFSFELCRMNMLWCGSCGGHAPPAWVISPGTG